jgi:hypothetical protein
VVAALDLIMADVNWLGQEDLVEFELYGDLDGHFQVHPLPMFDDWLKFILLRFCKKSNSWNNHIFFGHG